MSIYRCSIPRPYICQAAFNPLILEEKLLDNQYGPVYEIKGFSSLTAKEVTGFDDALLKHFLKKGAVAGRLSGGWLRVHVDRNSGYPDLDMEVSIDGRLLVCDMDIHKKGLLEDLRSLLKGFPKLSLEAVSRIK